MFYMFQVFLVVSVPIFVVAGVVLLFLMAWTEVKDYAHARIAMRRAAGQASSQSHPVESLRAA